MLFLKPWDKLPDNMRCAEVRPYYEILSGKRISLFLKRIFDIVMSLVMMILLAIPMIIIAIRIKTTSKGPIFYRQVRITAYGKEFRIHKFRTMVDNADKMGTEITVTGDSRITKVGATLRKYRLDELPQLFDILFGDMSFVGTRPEVPRYVKHYTPEMRATLLLPAGVTSKASILYKDEAELLDASSDPDGTYIEKVLPEKMKYNLDSLRNFSMTDDLKTMVKTVAAVVK